MRNNWNRLLDEAAKPVAVNAFFANGRLRDPATISILSALAKAYFAQFGTSDFYDVNEI